MRIVIGCFASKRYWANEEPLQEAYGMLREELVSLLEKGDETRVTCRLVECQEDLAKLEQGDCLILVPMSGGVQQNLLYAADRFPSAILYAAYIQGNGPEDITQTMMKYNAAPAVMDCWGVLKRRHTHVHIALNPKDLGKKAAVLEAYFHLQKATLLLVGDTEPWVISNSKELSSYEKLGIRVEKVPQQELVEIYRATTAEEGKIYYDYFVRDAKAVTEPTKEDLLASARMAAALVKMVEKYKAAGVAVACFKLLEEGTNSCLGVSFINDCTPYVASCEGDIDSAVTMLAMKRLSPTKLWMANPGLHPDGVINFSHCTAPLDLCGMGKCPYVLRSHHESGIGTSIETHYPVGMPVTACRISDEASAITIQKGTTVEGTLECACRTQVYVKFEDFDRYLETVLGCHQVFSFADIAEEMYLLAKELGLRIL